MTLLIAVASVVLVMTAYIGVPILFEELFHPASRQRRRHEGKDWQYAVVELPYVNTDGSEKVFIDTQVKYSEERGEYFLRNRGPKRFEADWTKTEADNIIQRIKDHA